MFIAVILFNYNYYYCYDNHGLPLVFTLAHPSSVVMAVKALQLGLVLALLLARPASSGSLSDIEHVVVFMQENRSWNNVGPLSMSPFCVGLLLAHRQS